MKKLRPGQFYTINGATFRVVKQTPGLTCAGCSLDDIALCPNIVDSRNGVRSLMCIENNVILKRIVKNEKNN